MSLFLFVFIHMMIGLGIIYFYNKLPKPIMTFAVVFFYYEFTILGCHIY